MQEISEYFEYSENSSTGLVARKDRIMWNGRVVYVKGDEVGRPLFRCNGDPKCISFCFKRKTLYAHNVVWELCTGQTVKGLIDHIDGNPFNNRITNLREVDHAANARNVKISKRNKTGVVGVCLTSSSKGRYTYYEAFVSALDGKLLRKKFMCTPNKEEAFQEACKWRKEQIEILNELGAGYTERHGK